MEEQNTTEPGAQDNQQQAPEQKPRRSRSRRATSPTTAPAPATEPTTAQQPETGEATTVGSPEGEALTAVAEKAAEAAAEKPARTRKAPAKRRSRKATDAADDAATTADADEPAEPAATEPSTEEPAAEAQAPAKARKQGGRRPAAKKAAKPAAETEASAPEAVDSPAADAQTEVRTEALPDTEGENQAAGDASTEQAEAPKRSGRGRRPSAAQRKREQEQELDVFAELGVDTGDKSAESATAESETVESETVEDQPDEDQPDDEGTDEQDTAEEGPRLPAAALLFQAPDTTAARPRRRRAQAPAGEPTPLPVGNDQDAGQGEKPDEQAAGQGAKPDEQGGEQGESDDQQSRRRRRRGGRGRRNRSPQNDSDDNGDDARQGDDNGQDEKGSQSDRPAKDKTPDRDRQQDGDRERPEQSDEGEDSSSDEGEGSSGSRRRRRRRRSARSENESEGRSARDEVTALKGSTRLEAKRQRRREGREAGRRRRPSLSESEFLARRESVNRKMIVREKDGLNQIAVLEDDMLVEHYVARHTQTSMVGNVYLGRVQNVLPSMEAAFVDLGKGRNAVLYAGEVNWDAAGMEGQPRRIEQALKSGDTVLVQVTKDPIGHKGARLTSQITLAGRHLVLVPSGAMTGISRKLPENERSRLKKLLKEMVPDGAGVIVRTAAEGATEDQLRADVDRLTKQWADIEAKSKNTKAAPTLLKGEPELAVRVVRDVFNEDFESLTVAGDTAWKTISTYVQDLSPELADRMHHWTSEKDVFAEHRVDEQLAKAMDRKVWLPSGGSLVIDRTEAMTVIDVNTGKFTGSGGTLEETVTRNNLESAEEIVRQLRLRDIGGIIVIDFIDMVLESNRDLVLRRLLECLGRDRTRHQVAEVTSLGLVQMTRKRVGQGLIEAFSSTCEHCNGRGFVVHDQPVERGADGGRSSQDDGGSRRRGGRRGGAQPAPSQSPSSPSEATAEDPESAAAREAVKATLATIAAAAANAHDQEDGSDEGSARDAAAGQADRSGQGGQADRQDGSPATPDEPPATGVVGAPSGGSVVVPTDAEEAAETAEPAQPGTPARRPRRSRRAVSSGVVTPGRTSITTVDGSEAGSESSTESTNG